MKGGHKPLSGDDSKTNGEGLGKKNFEGIWVKNW